MAIVEKSVLVHFSAQQMFDLVRAVGDYPQFLPWCSAGTVEPVEENRERACVEMSFKGIKQSFCTMNTLHQDKEIHMMLVDGPFSHLEGSWNFLELTPSACKIEFKLVYEFSSKLLEQLVGPVFTSITSSFVDSFIKRAEELYGTGAGH